jgi:hypothetical protein
VSALNPQTIFYLIRVYSACYKIIDPHIDVVRPSSSVLQNEQVPRLWHCSRGLQRIKLLLSLNSSSSPSTYKLIFVVRHHGPNCSRRRLNEPPRHHETVCGDAEQGAARMLLHRGLEAKGSPTSHGQPVRDQTGALVN